MDATAQEVLIALLGVLIGAGTTLAWRLSERELRGRPAGPPDDPVAGDGTVPRGVAAVLGALRSSALVVGDDDTVLQASASAYAMGLVREGRLCNDTVATLVTQVRRDGEIRQTELDLDRGRGLGPQHLLARVAPLDSRLVLVLAEDRTRERRVEAIRRDFVVNVSHELKTPVGALTLLAEAVHGAAHDPEAVERFSGRMQAEAARLHRLVQQIIELSRLQDGALDRPVSVDVDAVVDRAIEHSSTEAMAEGKEVVVTGRRGLRVKGNHDQVLLAVSNLVANAVAYSHPGTSVTVGTRVAEDGMVEIDVSDQGIGIPAGDVDRIFERFYRVDPARHRSTGGTGLGLSIVKHVASSHGGEVTVWSAEGEGSRFTLRLPPAAREAAPSPPPTPTTSTTSPPTAAPSLADQGGHR